MTFHNGRYLLADVGGLPSFVRLRYSPLCRIRQCAEKLPPESELDIPIQHDVTDSGCY